MGQAKNILWSHGGTVKIEDGSMNMRTIAPGTHGAFIVADPGFVNSAKDNFRLPRGAL